MAAQKFGKALLSAHVALAGFGMAGMASAQTATPDEQQASDGAPTEIIVTANKREQRLNDVGLSIVAASGDELNQAGVRETGDLAKITPGLTLTKTINDSPNFSIRGVGFNDYTLGASAAVAIYVDQVPLVLPAFGRGAVMDLERVEVLKGPQGLLFGQNSTGGAVNFIAAKPTRDLRGGLNLSYSRFATVEAETFISGPISDTLSARISVGTTQSGDWQRNYVTGTTNGSQDIFKGRAQLLWEPSDRFTVHLVANGWVDRSDTQATQLIGLQLARSVGTGATAAEVNRRIAALRAQPFAPADARAAAWTELYNRKRDDNFWQVSGRVDFELTDAISLTSITAYNRYDENYGVDRDGMVLSAISANTVGNAETFNQELRLSGQAAALNWVVGAGYSNNDVYQAVSPTTTDATNTIIIPGLPITISQTAVTQKIEEMSVFANAEYDFTDTLTLLAGARYTENQNDFTGCMTSDINFRTTYQILSSTLSGTPTALPGPNECLSFGADLKPTLTPHSLTLKEDNISWRVGLNYKPSDATLLYGLVSRGYKSGSFPVLSPASVGQFAPATQETVLAYEAGFKLGLANRAIQLNGSVFYYDYSDKQVRGKVADAVFSLLERLVNVPKSRILGAEIQTFIRPMDGLTFNISGTYIDSKVREYVGLNDFGVLSDFSGNVLPYTPKWQATAAADYRWSAGERVDAFVGGNFLYNSEATATLGSPKLARIKAFSTLDLRAGIAAPDDKWRLSIFGRNVFDTYYWPAAYLSQDVAVRIAARPATYGISGQIRF